MAELIDVLVDGIRRGHSLALTISSISRNAFRGGTRLLRRDAVARQRSCCVPVAGAALRRRNLLTGSIYAQPERRLLATLDEGEHRWSAAGRTWSAVVVETAHDVGWL